MEELTFVLDYRGYGPTTAAKRLTTALESRRTGLRQRRRRMRGISSAIRIDDARRAWSAQLGTLLDSAGAAARLNTTEPHVRELADAGELIALDDRAGGPVYPAFQFIVGAPPAALLDVWRILCDAAVSPWTAASWCASPDPGLAGQSPAQWAAQGHDPAVLVRIARRDAARLAR